VSAPVDTAKVDNRAVVRVLVGAEHGRLRPGTEDRPDRRLVAVDARLVARAVVIVLVRHDAAPQRAQPITEDRVRAITARIRHIATTCARCAPQASR